MIHPFHLYDKGSALSLRYPTPGRHSPAASMQQVAGTRRHPTAGHPHPLPYPLPPPSAATRPFHYCQTQFRHAAVAPSAFSVCLLTCKCGHYTHPLGASGCEMALPEQGSRMRVTNPVAGIKQTTTPKERATNKTRAKPRLDPSGIATAASGTRPDGPTGTRGPAAAEAPFCR